MRAIMLALLGLLLISSPALASDDHIFGTATCQQKISCLDAPESMSSSDIAANGNTCISKSFGISSVDGLFDEYAGLDANGCLTAKAIDGRKITPLCCVTKLPDNSCTFRCQLVGH